jgi:histone deacetylase complex regulatory component SIN3
LWFKRKDPCHVHPSISFLKQCLLTNHTYTYIQGTLAPGQFEEELTRTLGNECYVGFSLDKLAVQVVKAAELVAEEDKALKVAEVARR